MALRFLRDRRTSRQESALRSSRAARLQRVLLTPAALASIVAMLLVGGSGQALAASASAPATHRVSVQLTMPASAVRSSTIVPLSPAVCAAMKKDKELSPTANCVIGLALSASPDARVRHCGPNGTWTTCYDKGTICAGDAPVWGGKNGSFTCAEAYVSVDGRWKYKTPNNNHVWILGQVSCPKYANVTFGVSITHCNYRNNGHPILTMEANFNWTAQGASGNGYIAIYAHEGGKVTLYGAWNS